MQNTTLRAHRLPSAVLLSGLYKLLWDIAQNALAIPDQTKENRIKGNFRPILRVLGPFCRWAWGVHMHVYIHMHLYASIYIHLQMHKCT